MGGLLWCCQDFGEKKTAFPFLFFSPQSLEARTCEVSVKNSSNKRLGLWSSLRRSQRKSGNGSIWLYERPGSCTRNHGGITVLACYLFIHMSMTHTHTLKSATEWNAARLVAKSNLGGVFGGEKMQVLNPLWNLRCPRFTTFGLVLTVTQGIVELHERHLKGHKVFQKTSWFL